MADDLYSILQQVDPATLQKMVESGLYDERSKPLAQRFGVGNEMMQTPMAQGRNVGNTYVASSPIEHLSNAIRQALGAKMAGGAMQGENDLASQRGQGRLAYMRLLAQQPQQPQDPSQGLPPIGP